MWVYSKRGFITVKGVYSKWRMNSKRGFTINGDKQ